MRVYWTAEAHARLLEIQAYIAKDSPQAARRVAARLLRRSRKLATPPLIGRRQPEYPQDDLRELHERPFRLIYRVAPERIESSPLSITGRNCPPILGNSAATNAVAFRGPR